MTFERGFTLIELVVTMAMVAVLGTLALPSFQQGLNKYRIRAHTNSFLGSLALARSESLRRGERVVLCKSQDGLGCTVNGEWAGGWLVFEDKDNNGEKGPLEATIRYGDPLPEAWRFSGNSAVADYISYHPSGRTRKVNGAFQAGTLTLCRRSDGPTDGAQIIVSSSGRPRLVTKTMDDCA